MRAAGVVGVAALLLSQGVLAQAQGPRRAAPPAPKNAQEAAPIELTGYWVSVVDEDWRWRMLTPPKGDYESVPLNPLGTKLADTFEPSNYGPGQIDCRAYGAAGLMRMPTRAHITWADPNTLKLQTDWGEQTRLLHFVPGFLTGVSAAGEETRMPPAGAMGGQGAEPAASLQGTSTAIWQLPYQALASVGERGQQGVHGLFGIFGPGGMGPHLPGGDLRVQTSNLTPGWLRRNGVPYGAHTQMNEYYVTFTDPTGKQWFDVTTDVEDPQYLIQPFITSDDFRSEPDGSGWAPHPCKTVG